MSTKSLATILLTSSLAFGCASQPDKIDAQYVSPLQYKDYDCDQIAMEMKHINRRTGELYANLKEKADNDAAQMGIGLVLFWPTLFLLEGGDGPEAQEYARLKGEHEALRENAVKRKCNLETLPPSPEESLKQKQAHEPEPQDESKT